MENAIYLSQEALVGLEKELEELEKVRRPQAVEELRASRAQGDLSENFEFIAAREELRNLTKKISEIKGLLAYAKTVSTVSHDTIDIGTCFNATVISKGVSATNRYELVGYVDLNKINAALENNAPIPVTIGSPFGKAIRDKKAGEGFEFVDADNNRVIGEVVSIVTNLDTKEKSDKVYTK